VATNLPQGNYIIGGNMPVKAVGKKIVEKATGKVVGHSTSAAKAKSAARARNAARHGWKPGKRNR